MIVVELRVNHRSLGLTIRTCYYAAHQVCITELQQQFRLKTLIRDMIGVSLPRLPIGCVTNTRLGQKMSRRAYS